MGGGTPAKKYGAAVALGAAGLAGWLMVSGSLQPLVSDAVGLASSMTGAEKPRSDEQLVASYSYPSSSGDDWKDDMWMDDDSRPEWSSDRGVPQVSGRARAGGTVSGPRRPSIQVPENPLRIYPRNGATANKRITLEPMRSCFQQRGPAAQVPQFSVTAAGKGTAAISWWDIGDPDTFTYAITAVPTGGGKGTVKTIDVPAPKACRTVTASMSGLLPGQVYRFWLTATNKSPINGRIYRPGRGQSNSIVVK